LLEVYRVRGINLALPRRAEPFLDFTESAGLVQHPFLFDFLHFRMSPCRFDSSLFIAVVLSCTCTCNA
jgi:hypothetical protein